MLINDKYHVTYCTNIHPGENWESTFESFKKYIPTIKGEVSNKEAFGIGLRLSNTASEELNNGENLVLFKKWLEEEQLYVFTMNGFPYGNFHKEVVKDMVHAPDWTTDDRVIYTKRLFGQLAELLPEGMEGGISTSPISYKHWHNTNGLQDVFLKGAENFIEVLLQLYKIEKETGKYLHLDIEPEPDGLLENSDEVIRFFTDYLIPVAKKIIKERLAIDEDSAIAILHRHITVCYDVCHFSLAYEEPKDTLEKFKESGIKVGKIQVSSALKILFDKDNSAEIWDSLAKFNETTYLHQVTEKVGETVKTYNDLPVVLENRNDFTELRAHFHVPIFLEKFDALYSTQDQILKVIAYLKEQDVSKHLEIETYTWDVLPDSLRTDLSTGVIRELNWLKERL
ncbi:MAG: metabolite traffic protein EboE [Cellulophaga sp.]